MTGMLASSKAGHDKDRIYVIIKEAAEYVWLADGEVRKLDNPKKKRKKHIQVIRYFSDMDITGKLQTDKPVTDLDIRMFIKAYNQQRA